MKAAFESLKKAKKIRFAGLSCHDAELPEIVETAAEVGWIDQIMLKYNFRDVASATARRPPAGHRQGGEGEHRPRRDEDPGRLR